MKTMTLGEIETIAKLNAQRLNWEPRVVRPTSTTKLNVVIDDDTGAVEVYQPIERREPAAGRRH